MKENKLNNLYFYNNINPSPTKLLLNKDKSNINTHNTNYNNLNSFKLEYVIGKGGFGKVSSNNKY